MFPTRVLQLHILTYAFGSHSSKICLAPFFLAAPFQMLALTVKYMPSNCLLRDGGSASMERMAHCSGRADISFRVCE